MDAKSRAWKPGVWVDNWNFSSMDYDTNVVYYFRALTQDPCGAFVI